MGRVSLPFMSDHYSINVVPDETWSADQKGLVRAIAEISLRAARAEYLAMDLRNALNALAEKTLDGGAAALPKSLHLDLDRNAVRETLAYLRHWFPTARFAEEMSTESSGDPAPSAKS